MKKLAFYKTISFLREFDLKTKMFWNLAVVRAVFGTVATLGAIYTRWFDENLWYHITEGKSVFSYLFTSHNFGFFIFEVGAQIYFDLYFKTFSKELHLHHLFSFTGLYGVVIDDCNHFFSSSLIILEMSTPFSCICFCLLKAKKADTFIWKANQMLLVHIFHLRSVIEFIGLYDTYKNWNHVKMLPLLQIFSQVGGLVALAFYLTPYWTYRKTEQMISKSDFSIKEKDKKK